MLSNKKLFWGLGTFGLLFITGAAYKLKKLSNNLQIVIKPSVGMSLKGLKLKIEATLKNPTGGSMLVKTPFIVFQNAGKTFASSDSVDQDYKIPKYGQKQLDPITIEVPFLTMASEFPDMLKEYQQSGKITATIITRTTIDGAIPYSNTQSVVLLNKGGN